MSASASASIVGAKKRRESSMACARASEAARLTERRGSKDKKASDCSTLKAKDDEDGDKGGAYAAADAGADTDGDKVSVLTFSNATRRRSMNKVGSTTREGSGNTTAAPSASVHTANAEKEEEEGVDEEEEAVDDEK